MPDPIRVVLTVTPFDGALAPATPEQLGGAIEEVLNELEHQARIWATVEAEAETWCEACRDYHPSDGDHPGPDIEWRDDVAEVMEAIAHGISSDAVGLFQMAAPVADLLERRRRRPHSVIEAGDAELDARQALGQWLIAHLPEGTLIPADLVDAVVRAQAVRCLLLAGREVTEEAIAKVMAMHHQDDDHG